MLMQASIRNDWSLDEIHEIYNNPLLELIYRAATVHREYNETAEVQVCTLLSIKTGGCAEDCAYCPQAARYQTNIKVQKLLSVAEVEAAAQNAKSGGASRMC